MAKATICICTYNRADMLKESIESVLNQTYKDLKVVILDNASEDHTADVVALFDDPRLLYIKHEKSLGGFGNWNYALECADTDYVCIFHDDDRMLPWMIEEELKVMESDATIGMVASSIVHPLTSCSMVRKSEKLYGRHYGQMELIREYCRIGHNNIVAPSVLFRKRSIDQYALRFRPDKGAAADWYLWMEANTHPFAVYLIHYPLLETRTHENQGTSIYSGLNDAWLYTYKQIEDFLRNLDINLKLDKIIEGFAKSILTYYILGFGAESIHVDDLQAARRELYNKEGWAISDSAFFDACSVGVLGKASSALNCGMISWKEYRTAIAEYKKRGFKIPVQRDLKWILKFLFYKFSSRK